MDIATMEIEKFLRFSVVSVREKIRLADFYAKNSCTKASHSASKEVAGMVRLARRYQ